MVSGQCKGMYPDQPDRPRSVCSGNRIRTFFPFGAVLMLTSITGVWLFAFHAGSFGRRTGWTMSNRTDPFLHALDIRRKNLTDSTESEKGRSTDDRTAAIWRG